MMQVQIGKAFQGKPTNEIVGLVLEGQIPFKKGDIFPAYVMEYAFFPDRDWQIYTFEENVLFLCQLYLEGHIVAKQLLFCYA